MAVTTDDVRHIAELARLGVDEARIPSLVEQLNGILGHMEVLQKADVRGAEDVAGIGSAGMPLRADAGPSVPLARPIAAFAPAVEGGFLLVPRLATHVDGDPVDDSVEAES